jgi:hypothetical protein
MTLATASVTSVAQNIIFYVSEVIDIIYIYKLSKKISYHNFLVRKKETIPYYEIASFMYSKI